MQITVREVRLAWGVLMILAALSYPAPPYPGPKSLAAVLLAFAPGGFVLSTERGGARIADGLGRLVNETTGRLSLLAAIVLAVLVGLTFDAFVAFTLTGLFCSLLWSAAAVFRSAPWEQRFERWIVAGLSSFVTLAIIDAVLNWGPVARRLGTPAELNQWERRYDGVWGESNIFQFRSPYEDTRRRPGVRRVIALGDSFTWGSKIASSDSTWPALLEHRMREAPGDGPTEVINMGHGGYATGNEAEELRRFGWQFHPDLVIVQWLDNDAYVTLPNFKTASPGPFVNLVRPQYRTGWIRNSGILLLLERVLTSSFYGALDLNGRHYTPDSPGWVVEQQAFREMGDSASRYCTPILLVLYPDLFPGRWTLETYPERDIHGMVAAAAQHAGLDVLDLLPAFVAAGKDFKDWWGTAYDSHPGGAAQVLAARTIANYLEEHKLLADSTAGAGRCRP